MPEIEPPDLANPLNARGEPKRKLPAWAILLAVLAFIAFNSFFALFAMQISNGGGN